MLEAYALGAVEPEEGAHIEEHLAECLACWEHLSESQRTAALLALAVPLEEPRESLRQRIIARAKRDAVPAAEPSPRRWRLPRFAAVGATALALSAVGVLSWSVVHVHNDVQQQATVNGQQETTVHKLAAVLMSPDVQKETMVASGIAATAAAYYVWTRNGNLGSILCHDLPPAPEGSVYQVWLSYDRRVVSGGTFTPSEGECLHSVSLEPDSPLSGVAVSVEPSGGSSLPSNDIVLTASFTPR
jgi:hypothetical protein